MNNNTNKPNVLAPGIILILLALLCLVVPFSSACRHTIEITPGIDILGFVENDAIIADGPIADGVIVTPGFIVEFRRLKVALERCEKKGE